MNSDPQEQTVETLLDQEDTYTLDEHIAAQRDIEVRNVVRDTVNRRMTRPQSSES